MNFDWKAFEEGKLAYNARTEEDAKAFIEECEKRGARKSLEFLRYGTAHWKIHGEYTCYHRNIAGVCFCDIEYFRQKGINIFSDPWKKQESVVEILRSAESKGECGLCNELFSNTNCDERRCVDQMLKIADMVEAELEEAKRTAAYTTDKPLAECVAHYTGIEAKDRESIKDYLSRNFYEKPRGKDGQLLELGKTYFGGDGRPWCVLGFRPGVNYNVIGSYKGEINTHLRSKWLSSVKPDTQERIDTEARMTPAAYCARHDIPILDSLDSISVTRAMIAHLLERQRRLDARTIGGEK